MTNEEKAAKKAEEHAAKEAAEKAPAHAMVKELFGQFPAAQELYFTSDGLAFLVKSDAQNHARSLDAKEVETIKRNG